MAITLAGFCGILAMVALSLTRNLGITIGLHLVLWAALVGYWIYKEGGIRSWVSSKIHAGYGIHPALVGMIGLLFVMIGLAIIISPVTADFHLGGAELRAENGKMTQSEACYFGSIPFLLGSGVALMAFTDCWLRKTRRV